MHVLTVVVVSTGIVWLLGSAVWGLVRKQKAGKRLVFPWISLALGAYALYIFAGMVPHFPTGTVVAGSALGVILGIALLALERRRTNRSYQNQEREKS